MKIRKVELDLGEIMAFLDSRLAQRLKYAKESMERDSCSETGMKGPDAETVMDIWYDIFRMAAKKALASSGHEFRPAYTDDTVELLTREGIGMMEVHKPFQYTDVRLKNGRFRIYKDSYEYGDGAVRLLEPASGESVVTGLEEEELAGFLLAFDALIPAFRERLVEWGRKMEDAAQHALAMRKADRIAQIAVDELLEKYVRPLGMDWDCSVSKGMVDLVLYGPHDDVYLEIPLVEFPAFIQDREAFSAALKENG